MSLRDGTASIAVDFLSDSLTRHVKQFRDSKIARRNLSSEKGKLSAPIASNNRALWRDKCSGFVV
jgi:hypothetical protein